VGSVPCPPWSSEKADVEVRPVRAAYWPETTFHQVPPIGHAATLAMELRCALGLGRAPLGPIGPICRASGACLRVKPLRSAQGGLEAILSPRIGGFEITVDTEPPGGWGFVPAHLREALHRHRLRFRVAHELGHTFFYDRGSKHPRRMVPDSNDQEQFCDEFARALLIPPAAIPLRLPDPRAVVELAQQYDVSLEVAVRAAAAKCPDLWLGLYVRRPGETIPQWLSSPNVGPSWVRSWVDELGFSDTDLRIHRTEGGWDVVGVGLADRRQLLMVARRQASLPVVSAVPARLQRPRGELRSA
jgi:hypothetical protein